LLEQLARIIRRRKWIVISAIVLVPLVAFLYSHRQEKQYTATANLYFNDPTVGVLNAASSNVSIDPTRQAATDSALVSLPIVSVYASRETDGRISAAEIQSSVSVDSDTSNSDVIAVQAVSSSPQRAADIANAYGRGYIDFRRTSDRAALQTNIDQVQAQLDQLTPEQQASQQGRQLSDQIEALRTAQALRTGDAELVQPAGPPSSPSSPKTKRNVAIGVFIGIVLGLGLAALLEQFDRRIRTVEDLERVYGLPVLARVPRNRQLTRGEIPTNAAEPFRGLRTNLRYLSFDRRLRSLLVASPLPADGKSTIARALATTMAGMGDHVVLVDLDLHKQDNSRHDEVGLSTVLVGDDLDHALIEQEVPAADGSHSRLLTVLPKGPTPPNPSELIDSERMHEVLRELEQSFDYVIIDAPAMASVSDGLSVVPSVSGVLLVGGLAHTTYKAAVDLRRQIALLHGHPIGIVANFTRAPRRGYEYGY
jgi:capsular exopolysaccharide synthesis family protein